MDLRKMNRYLIAPDKKTSDRTNKEASNIVCLFFGHKWNHKYKEPIYCKRCKKYRCFY